MRAPLDWQAVRVESGSTPCPSLPIRVLPQPYRVWPCVRSCISAPTYDSCHCLTEWMPGDKNHEMAVTTAGEMAGDPGCCLRRTDFPKGPAVRWRPRPRLRSLVLESTKKWPIPPVTLEQRYPLVSQLCTRCRALKQTETVVGQAELVG